MATRTTVIVRVEDDTDTTEFTRLLHDSNPAVDELRIVDIYRAAVAAHVGGEP